MNVLSKITGKIGKFSVFDCYTTIPSLHRLVGKKYTENVLKS